MFASERDDLVALGHELLEAWMAFELPCQFDPAGRDSVLDAEGSGAKLADSDDSIFHGCVKPVEFMIRFLQFENPLCPGAVKNQLHVLVAVLELLDAPPARSRHARALHAFPYRPARGLLLWTSCTPFKW